MARVKAEGSTATPRGSKKLGSNSQTNSKLKQTSLMSFFSKSQSPKTGNTAKPKDNTSSRPTSQESFPSPSSSPSRDSNDTTQIQSSHTDKENIKPDDTVETTVDLDDEEEEEVKAPIKLPATPATDSSVIKRPLKESKQQQSDPSSSPAKLPSSPTRRQRKNVISYNEDSDDDEEGDLSVSKTQRQRKKRRVIADDGSEDEFVPDAKSESEDDADEAFVVPDDFEDKKDQDVDDDLDDDDFIEITKPSTKPKSKSPAPIATSTKPKTNLSNKFTSASPYKAKVSQPVTKSPTPPKAQTKSQKFTKENEERYQWLIDIRDADRNSITDPQYDPRTLYIPSSAWAKFTNFEKQYWEIKSKMWDCIVFFKKGKFYELYEKDAMIAHNEFDLKIAGGGRANMQLAGIPEMSFDFWATSFITKGYKVAKVDQIETGLAKEIRESNGQAPKGKKDVIQRELKCVLTAGTLTDESMLSDDMATYCIAVKEDVDPENENGKVFGVAFIDTATGQIQLTEFKDDSECTKLETLASQLRPKELIISKNNLSQLALRILKFNSQNNAIFNYIKSESEFYDFDTTFETLTRGKYFPAESLDDLSNWPKTLKEFYETQKFVGFSAFGGLLWYLQSLKLDESLVSIGNISPYTTIKPSTNLVLDGQTLQNLEIFANSFDGTEKGTLFKLINRATTPFGKRLLKTWVVHPLLQQTDIDARLDSVDQLLEDGDLRSTIEFSLVKLPDLERLLSRVHASQLKLKDFTRVIEGFEDIAKLYKKLQNFEMKGSLGKIYSKFPNEIQDSLSKWDDAFDRVKAKDEGVLILSKGIEQDYDDSVSTIKDLEHELEATIKQYRRTFKTQEINYKDSGKELYTIEMPSRITVPKDWKRMGASKKTTRYWSPEVETMAKDIARAKECHKLIEESLITRMFKRFDTDYSVWSSAINAIAKIDCLVSLAKTSESIGFPSVRPKFVESETGILEFKELRHPCFNMGITASKDFIPNDISLGGSSPNLGLLTGANAAGKSTVLRMTCIAVLLAQIGSHVPCESATLTPVDRIMTRLGANDNIMQGKSTFFVELSETKRILENATPKSLLVLDELGRGGSSSDGFAIAEAVLHHVATHIQSLGFFATHYGSLGQSFQNHPQIKPFRMAIIVDNESKNITFLYKLEEGAAEGSFGMHVASMCGIEKEIIDNSEIAAETFEHTSKLKRTELNQLSAIPLGLQSDIARLLKQGFKNSENGAGEGVLIYNETVQKNALQSIGKLIDAL
ncbi:DNA mismatch repair protein [Wickerhamomyces ciferrii]|uniref:DNA mismatch repair protein n=1 Tax=Wickerhamomyces ciferrii (strain ATCC 14091 / BCRC 22168 / CBS 111 / JCM 3599 / NBRC 0793 / NRRL Y-1031 F-60-10) TaxID=1206466 RepID=K0KNW5_WICCF|nr:DNA mismatch repair protein [Wickerhamomyces ciferrii]CCH43094.1 DNA mismatch repair protein [Wickerhamomyces ciferrii]